MSRLVILLSASLAAITGLCDKHVNNVFILHPQLLRCHVRQDKLAIKSGKQKNYQCATFDIALHF